MKVIAIWVLFFAYLIFMIFLYISTEEIAPEARTIESDTSFVPEAVQFSQERLDSLQRAFYRAYNDGNYEDARLAAAEIAAEYPESEAATEVALLMERIDAPPATKRVSNKTGTNRAAPRRTPRRSAPAATQTTPEAVKTPAEPPSEIVLEGGAPYTSEETARMMSRLRRVHDEETGITWYYNKSVSHYLYKNSVEVYLGQNAQNELWLRLRVYYNGERNLDLLSFEFYADDREYTLPVLRGNLEAGEGLKGAWAWYDTRVQAVEYTFITAVMNSERAAIRYVGENGTVQRAIGELEKLRVQHVVDLFEALYRNGGYISSNTIFPRP